MLTFVKEKGWRQCKKCNSIIELGRSCIHMSCKCGYEFCYVCGVKFYKKSNVVDSNN